MKTERRHELEKNELADWLAKGFEQVGPYTNYIWIGIATVAVLGIGYQFFSQHQSGQRGEAWSDYLFATFDGTPAKYSSVAEKFAGTPAGAMARLQMADEQLTRGNNNLFTNRKVALGELEKAKGEFILVVGEAESLSDSQRSLILQRALMGLGQTYEGLGQISKATETYEQLNQKYPQSSLSRAARERIKDLKSDSTIAWYQWFREQDPKPAVADRGGRAPGDTPGFEVDDPDFPHGNTTEDGGLKTPPAGKATDSTDAPSSADTPATKGEPEPEPDPEPAAKGEPEPVPAPQGLPTPEPEPTPEPAARKVPPEPKPEPAAEPNP